MSGWLLISSRQNLNISASLAFRQQGLKKRHRKKALLIEPGDCFFFYITGEQKLAAISRVESSLPENNDKIWVNLGKDPDECYPWRFKTSLLILLPENSWIPMEHFSKQLSHFKKWPAKNWRLGLQGQIHALRDEDTAILSDAFNR
ncbi:MAG: EVE domain-containing protein [Candidatus Marinimicrobia bacterium]|nr:EVE domain-containing protein [Candidatus Neomarinimicrobiota bacterium]